MCRFLLCNDLRSGLGVELGVDRPPKEWEWEWIKKSKHSASLVLSVHESQANILNTSYAIFLLA